MERGRNSTNLTFAAFYTPLSQEQLSASLKKVTDSKLKWSQLPKVFADWEAYLQVFFLSTRRSHPNCRNVLITDFETRAELPEDVDVVRMQFDKEKLMYEKLRCQISFLREYPQNDSVIFLDNDMIVQGSLEHLFEKDFDIGFTYMLYHSGELYELPISNGVMIIPCEHRQKAIQFLEEVKNIYKNEYFTPNLLKWQGGEFAIRKRIGYQKIAQAQFDILSLDSYRILLLDPNIYNFSSPSFFEMKDFFPEKKILHFKHLRKPEMLIYWKLHLQGSSSGL